MSMVESTITETNFAALTSSIIVLNVSLARATISSICDWWLRYLTRLAGFVRCCSRVESQCASNFRSPRKFPSFESGVPSPAYSQWPWKARLSQAKKKSGIDQPVKDSPVPFHLFSLSFYELHNHGAVLTYTYTNLCYEIWFLCLAVSTGIFMHLNSLCPFLICRKAHKWISPAFLAILVDFLPATEAKQLVCSRRINYWPPLVGFDQC